MEFLSEHKGSIVFSDNGKWTASMDDGNCECKRLALSAASVCSALDFFKAYVVKRDTKIFEEAVNKLNE